MLWRVRTSLADRPGSLARITSTCGENGLNILALQIFPEVGSVIDELVLEAADEWTGQEIASIVAAAGGDTVGVTPPDTVVDHGARGVVKPGWKWRRSRISTLKVPVESMVSLDWL